MKALTAQEQGERWTVRKLADHEKDIKHLQLENIHLRNRYKELDTKYEVLLSLLRRKVL